MNLGERTPSMEFVPPSEHLCYVRCNFCTIVLAVEIPYQRLSETVTVKCGHCSNLLFLSPMHAASQGQCMDHTTTLQMHKQMPMQMQMQAGGLFSDLKMKGQSPASTHSSTSTDSLPPIPFVVKPPERRHRLPSAYNRFMKEEIQRIKVANPQIPHREAFSAAAKNWARCIPNTPAPVPNQQCLQPSNF